MSDQASSEKQTVLVVDDAISNIKMLGEILREDCDISFATNGKSALSQALKLTPDLILLDVVMPDMDGYEVCQHLKQNPATTDIPVIFITALDSIEDEEKGLEMGAIDYIAKPFHPPIVKMRVRNHLELVRHRKKLNMLSTTDGLTGIANRRRFDDLLHKEWRRALREEEPLSILMIDIDNFKRYNDLYGHLKGDECLKHVATILQNRFKRETDILARYGGEEFAAVLPNTELAGAQQFALQLMEAIEKESIVHENNGEFNIVTLSMGVTALIPDNNIELSDALSFSDGCLYEAKNAGRNQCIARLFPGSQ
ncbi:diguanylate cyclase [Planctobacterium marinum]|uniref:diguanylate cyclase n=1 Tax=Planctobacterium marinum TaxID=1631968 RepID=A0AA48I5F4_9ALTE|nr:hypothetical protein MACH26_17760 [Planctobacterium marinum]